MELRVNEHRGMGTQIAKEKLPTWLYQKIHNLELSKKLGRMVKRGGCANVLTTGLATLNGMKEFTDNNDGRQILIQDGTGLEESVYSGGAYQGITAISNNERESAVAPTVTQMYPVLHEKVLRSGAGIAATHDHPFHYGYIGTRERFNNAGDAQIAAGKYLTDQYYGSDVFSSTDKLKITFAMATTANGSVSALPEGTLYFVVAPVYDGYQRGFPILDKVRDITENFSMKVTLQILDTYEQRMKRITAIDVFIATTTEKKRNQDIENIPPAYFLERIDLNEDSSVFMSVEGTLETVSPPNIPTYVEFDDDFADWEPDTLVNFYVSFTASTDYEIKLGTRTENGTKVRYALAGLDNADSGDAATFNIFSRWYESTQNHIYPFLYDNYYKKLRAEMYTYLDLPTGDFGLSDFRYKFSCMANKRYFVFGTPDGAFGYYSKTNNPDVIPALNILRLDREPTGCVAVGRDVIAFYPSSSKRFTILGNENADEDDTFSDIGLVSQKAIMSVSDEESYGFDLRGPWTLHRRSHRFIGSLLTDWWEDELSEAEKSACVVSYNRLKNWVLYSFPTYTGTHDSFTYTGITFVFDRGYYLKSGRRIEPWWIIQSAHTIYNWTIAEDDNLHLLTGSKTAIVDWNVPLRANQDESVKTLAHIKLLKNPILGNKTHFDKLYMYFVSDTDSMVAKIRPDDGSWVTLTVNDDQQAVIKYLAETLELELSTVASKNDVEISEEVIIFTPLRSA